MRGERRAQSRHVSSSIRQQRCSEARTGHALYLSVSKAAVEAVLAEHDHALVVQALHDAVAHRGLTRCRAAWSETSSLGQLSHPTDTCCPCCCKLAATTAKLPAIKLHRRAWHAALL